MSRTSIPSVRKESNPVSGTRTIRLLIVEDHALVCAGLNAILSEERDFDVVACASNGREAVEIFEKHHPDVVLMDLRMPEMDGTEATRQIIAKDPAAHIIILTAFAGQEDIYRALEAGATGYLLKSASREQLFQAIRCVHSGDASLPQDLADKVAERMASRQLSDREMQVLVGMAEGKSNQQIGETLSISEGTVKCHVNSVFHKLDVNDRTKAVMLAIRRGLIHM